MSGLEIVAGVAAIVSAFNGSVTLFRSWRDKRRERLEKTQNQNLDRSLTIGGSTVQREYDGHFARLGQQFAVGDDRSRAELAGYVIKLQHVIITMLTESNSTTSLLLPSLPTIYSTSEDTRTGVVSALTEQYQRMAQARPLSISHSFDAPSQTTTFKNLPTSSPLFLGPCQEDKSTSFSHYPYLVRNSDTGAGIQVSCRCGFRDVRWDTDEHGLKNCDWGLADMLEIIKYHYQPRGCLRSIRRYCLYCPICEDSNHSQTFSDDEMVAHLGSHSLQELYVKGFLATSSHK